MCVGELYLFIIFLKDIDFSISIQFQCYLAITFSFFLHDRDMIAQEAVTYMKRLRRDCDNLTFCYSTLH